MSRVPKVSKGNTPHVVVFVITVHPPMGPVCVYIQVDR